MANTSPLVGVRPGDGPPLATAGAGLVKTTREVPEVSGTEPEQKHNAPGAFVTLRNKKTGESLGTYLVSMRLDSQMVEVDGQGYDLVLRPKRIYKPYTLTLLKFTHYVYPGTDKPRNFASRLLLKDPTADENREVNISMNSPLRYRGETFFQSSFLEHDAGTILQVVRNPGWPMPYISCLIVGVGMLIHFSLHLNGFIRRRFAL